MRISARGRLLSSRYISLAHFELIVNSSLKLPESPNTEESKVSLTTTLEKCPKTLTDDLVVSTILRVRKREVDVSICDLESLGEDNCGLGVSALRSRECGMTHH